MGERKPETSVTAYMGPWWANPITPGAAVDRVTRARRALEELGIDSRTGEPMAARCSRGDGRGEQVCVCGHGRVYHPGRADCVQLGCRCEDFDPRGPDAQELADRDVEAG